MSRIPKFDPKMTPEKKGRKQSVYGIKQKLSKTKPSFFKDSLLFRYNTLRKKGKKKKTWWCGAGRWTEREGKKKQ